VLASDAQTYDSRGDWKSSSRVLETQSRPKTELEYKKPLYVAGGSGVVGPGHRQVGEQGDKAAVCAYRHAGKDGGAGRGQADRMRSRPSAYRGKAKNVIALSKILIEKHGGQVPKSREALEELPGVGRKDRQLWF